MVMHSGGRLAGAVSAAGALGSFGGMRPGAEPTWVSDEVRLIRDAYGIEAGEIDPVGGPDHQGVTVMPAAADRLDPLVGPSRRAGCQGAVSGLDRESRRSGSPDARMFGETTSQGAERLHAPGSLPLLVRLPIAMVSE